MKRRWWWLPWLAFGVLFTSVVVVYGLLWSLQTSNEELVVWALIAVGCSTLGAFVAVAMMQRRLNKMQARLDQIELDHVEVVRFASVVGAVETYADVFDVSKREACKQLNIPHSTYYKYRNIIT